MGGFPGGGGLSGGLQGALNHLLGGGGSTVNPLPGFGGGGSGGVNPYIDNATSALQQALGGGSFFNWSDFRLKENISLVGRSDEGVNIYEFDYKDDNHGKGRYRGVMAQEVPHASIENDNGYLSVDYSKLDVNFERVA